MSDQNLGVTPPEPEQGRPRRALPDEGAQWEDVTPTEQLPPVTDQSAQRGFPEDAEIAPAELPPSPPDSFNPATDEVEPPNRLPLIIGGIVVLLGIALIVWLGMRDRGQETEPAPVPTESVTTTETPTEPAETPIEPEPTTEAPVEPSPTEVAPTEEPATEEPTDEPTEPEQVIPEGDPEPLTPEHLPAELLGYTLGEDLIYTRDDGHSIFVMDMNAWMVDPTWQELTFPDAQPVAENALCSPDEGDGQGCIITSSVHGVLTASGDPGVDITEFVIELAEHLR